MISGASLSSAKGCSWRRMYDQSSLLVERMTSITAGSFLERLLLFD